MARPRFSESSSMTIISAWAGQSREERDRRAERHYRRRKADCGHEYRADRGSGKEAFGSRFEPGHEVPLRYCVPGVLPVNSARRNASGIASPLAGTEFLGRARASAGRICLSDPVGAISARTVVGLASGA
jgi:hypothetical protein